MICFLASLLYVIELALKKISNNANPLFRMYAGFPLALAQAAAEPRPSPAAIPLIAILETTFQNKRLSKHLPLAAVLHSKIPR